MAGRTLRSLVVIAVLVSLIGLFTSGNPTTRASFLNAGMSAALNCDQGSCENPLTDTGYEPGNTADYDIIFSIPAPSANFADNITFTPPDFVLAWGETIPVGAEMGFLDSKTKLGTLNQACSDPLETHFDFRNGTTDITNTFHVTPDMTTIRGDGDISPHDDNCESGNGLWNHIDCYPDFENLLFDPDYIGPGDDLTPGTADDDNGPKPPLIPRMRLTGYDCVAGVCDQEPYNGQDVLLDFVVFNPGQLSDPDKGFAPPHPFSQIGPEFGYPTIVILNNPMTPLAPSAITDFCSPLGTMTTLFGKSQDNTDTTPDEGGYTARTNPKADTGLRKDDGTGTNTHLAVYVTVSYRDFDNDTADAGVDTCEGPGDARDQLNKEDFRLTTGIDGDNIDSSCDRPESGVDECGATDIGDGEDDDLDGVVDDGCPNSGVLKKGDPNVVCWPGYQVMYPGASPTDCDADGYPNAQDNCPLIANGADCYVGPTCQWEEETVSPLPPDGGPREDNMGNACDPDPDLAQGHYHVNIALSAMCVGDPPADADGDGWCDAYETEVGSDGSAGTGNPGGDQDGDKVGNATDKCPVDYDPGQADGDVDGIGDACEVPFTDWAGTNEYDCALDYDCDTIPNLGTFGTRCSGGATVDCDDNCDFYQNPLQEDADSDAIGDPCDPTLVVDDSPYGRPEHRQLTFFPTGTPFETSAQPIAPGATGVSEPCDDGIDNDGDTKCDTTGCNDPAGTPLLADPACEVDVDDDDGDGIDDTLDNCDPNDATALGAAYVDCANARDCFNPTQTNTDEDFPAAGNGPKGNACDPDDDNDGYADSTEYYYYLRWHVPNWVPLIGCTWVNIDPASDPLDPTVPGSTPDVCDNVNNDGDVDVDGNPRVDEDYPDYNTDNEPDCYDDDFDADQDGEGGNATDDNDDDGDATAAECDLTDDAGTGPPDGDCDDPGDDLTLCDGAGDDDGDGWVNDGCPEQAGSSETPGEQCDNNYDDDADTYVNDGCPVPVSKGTGPTDYMTDDRENFAGTKKDQMCSVLASETGTQCDNDSDDDGDGYVNDGCPTEAGSPETGEECAREAHRIATQFADFLYPLFDDTDDDGDTKVNDGCPARAPDNDPFDNNRDGKASILDIMEYYEQIPATAPPAYPSNTADDHSRYSRRLDINADGRLSITDIMEFFVDYDVPNYKDPMGDDCPYPGP